MLIIDGAYGEGGGQIIRTALTMAVVLSQPIRLENIRANRKNPGLAAQHLTAVRAAAMICDAEVYGDELGSTRLTFIPQSCPIPGLYEFDIGEARVGGSAGAVTLVLQTILLPLACAHASSEVTLKGGTHVPWSPSFHYIRDVYLPTLTELRFQATATLSAWGWYPAGHGQIKVKISGQENRNGEINQSSLALEEHWLERGPIRQVNGIAIASSLPAHIAQRMRDHAIKLLEQAGLPATVEPKRVRSASPGAGIFLAAEYGDRASRAGFAALGKKGKPSEQVAEEAVNALLAFHRSGAALDKHLTDQIILPIALLGIPTILSTEQLTQHTLTNIWVIEQFLGQITEIDRRDKTVRFRRRNEH